MIQQSVDGGQKIVPGLLVERLLFRLLQGSLGLQHRLREPVEGRRLRHGRGLRLGGQTLPRNLLSLLDAARIRKLQEANIVVTLAIQKGVSGWCLGLHLRSQPPTGECSLNGPVRTGN